MSNNENALWGEIKSHNLRASIGMMMLYLGIPICIIGGILFLPGYPWYICMLVVVEGVILFVAGGAIATSNNNAVNRIIWEQLGPFIETTYDELIGKHDYLDKSSIDNFRESVRVCGLIRDFNKVESCNEREATFKGKVYTAGNVKLVYETVEEDSDGDEVNRDTIFEGVWISFGFDKLSVNEEKKKKMLDNIRRLSEGDAFFGTYGNVAHIAVETSHFISSYNKSMAKGIDGFDELKVAIINEIKYEAELYEEIGRFISGD